MGRREDREALQSTWNVYEPAQPGRPMTRADREQAIELEELRDARKIFRMLSTGEFIAPDRFDMLDVSISFCRELMRNPWCRRRDTALLERWVREATELRILLGAE